MGRLRSRRLTIRVEVWGIVRGDERQAIIRLARRAVRDGLSRTIEPLLGIGTDQPGATWLLTVVITNDQTIRRLNRQFLARDLPTDVLAFPTPVPTARSPIYRLDNPGANLLGEIYISRDQARVQARRYGLPFRQELLRLALHGLLHLLGLTHREMTACYQRYLEST